MMIIIILNHHHGQRLNQFHHHNNNHTNMIMKCECEKGNPSCLFQRLLLQKVWRFE